MSPGPRRALVFGLILGAHVFLAYVLEESIVTSRSGTRPDGVARISVTFLEDRPQPDLQPPKSTRTPNAQLPRPKPSHLTLPEAPLPQSDEPSNSAITDWSSEAHAAAADFLQQQQQKSHTRSFARIPQPPNPPETPGVFGSGQQNHRVGRVEGAARFWVTDDCYYDIPRGSPPPRMAGEFHLLIPTCKPPPSGGGDKMFDHLKPESLKALPKLPPN